MGPLDQVVSSLPGMGANMITKGREKESVARIKRFLCMMDSMTAQGIHTEIYLYIRIEWDKTNLK